MIFGTKMFQEIKEVTVSTQKISVLPRLRFLPVTFFPQKIQFKQSIFEKLIKLSFK